MKKLLFAIFIMFAFLSVHKASANGVSSTGTVWESNPSATAGNVNAGGFNPTNANFLTDLSATSATSASPVASSTAYAFVAGDVGDWIFIKSGTNWTANCWYQIASVSSGKATLSADIGQGVCMNSNLGGPNPRWIATTVQGIASTASPTSGTWGLDYSQGTSAVRSWQSAGGTFTNNLTCTNVANSVCTSASYNFQTYEVGNFIHVTTGTNATTSITNGALWAEIVSVSGGAATLDHNITSTAGNLTSATAFEGGSMSLNSTLDDDFFETGNGANGGGCMTYFFKSGNYSAGEAINVSAAGGTNCPIDYVGYNNLRGDAPSRVGGSQPILNNGANQFTAGAQSEWYNMTFIGSGATVATFAANDKVVNDIFVDYSTTAGRPALTSGNNSQIFNNEAMSYRGPAVLVSNNTGVRVMGNYFHDSDTCLKYASAQAGETMINNLLQNCPSFAVLVSSAWTSNILFYGNTFYGAENKQGTGVSIFAGSTAPALLNNIFYGFNVAASSTDVSAAIMSQYNDYFNNNNNGTSTAYQLSTTDQTLDPQFTNVHQFTGTNASSTTNVLTYTTGGFNAVVTDDVSVVNITSGSGTGFVAGLYPIHSHTDTTLTLASPAPGSGTFNVTTSGNGTSLNFQITYGLNFAIGTNLKADGFPGAISPSTTGYLDIGAVQRQEPSGGSCATISYACVGN